MTSGWLEEGEEGEEEKSTLMIWVENKRFAITSINLMQPI